MRKVTEVVSELAAPLAEAVGCSLWDVEYVREAGSWYLRIYIDCPGGVNIDQCEAVSRPLSDKLDALDPIEGSYILEVSSAGAGRPLKKAAHFAAFLGSQVDVRLYRPRDGAKEYTGELIARTAEETVIRTGGTELTFPNRDVALVRLHMDF